MQYKNLIENKESSILEWLTFCTLIIVKICLRKKESLFHKFHYYSGRLFVYYIKLKESEVPSVVFDFSSIVYKKNSFRKKQMFSTK